MIQSRNRLLRKLRFVFMVVACMIEDSDGELRKQGDQWLKYKMWELTLGEKQRGLEPRFHSSNIFKENQGA